MKHIKANLGSFHSPSPFQFFFVSILAARLLSSSDAAHAPSQSSFNSASKSNVFQIAPLHVQVALLCPLFTLSISQATIPRPITGLWSQEMALYWQDQISRAKETPEHMVEIVHEEEVNFSITLPWMVDLVEQTYWLFPHADHDPIAWQIFLWCKSSQPIIPYFLAGLIVFPGAANCISWRPTRCFLVDKTITAPAIVQLVPPTSHTAHCSLHMALILSMETLHILYCTAHCIYCTLNISHITLLNPASSTLQTSHCLPNTSQ